MFLKEVTLFNLPLLEVIDDYTFCNCPNLKTIEFMKLKSLEKIRKYAFHHCEEIENIDLSDTNVKTIEEFAFSGHEEVVQNPYACVQYDDFYLNVYHQMKPKSITLPRCIESIHENAFDLCVPEKVSTPARFSSLFEKLKVYTEPVRSRFFGYIFFPLIEEYDELHRYSKDEEVPKIRNEKVHRIVETAEKSGINVKKDRNSSSYSDRINQKNSMLKEIKKSLEENPESKKENVISNYDER
jgi:hypothetical protein